MRAIRNDPELRAGLAAAGACDHRGAAHCAHRADELLAIVERLRGAAIRGGGVMRIAFYGSSLVSAYWNGAATYYRGLLRHLAALATRSPSSSPTPSAARRTATSSRRTGRGWSSGRRRPRGSSGARPRPRRPRGQGERRRRLR
ncbi:MAG: hypothetical protein R3C69_18700 [Geminicoccaceae bacterium]